MRLRAAALALMLTGCAHVERPACPASPADVAAIESVIRAFFDAAGKGDAAAFRRVTTDSFYAFEVGRRLEETALVDLVRDSHARGVQLNWNIGPIDARVDCNIAWAAWENVGSAGVPPKVEPVRWLESAALIREEGLWKIDFFQSMRAAPGR